MQPVYKQAAVIPYRFINGQLEILLITSLKKKKWIVPKGIIEDGFSPVEAARKEALEEGGIDGRAENNSLGTYTYKKWGGICHVQLFAMAVESVFDDWDEKALRKRRWISETQLESLNIDKNILPFLKDFFLERKT